MKAESIYSFLGSYWADAASGGSRWQMFFKTVVLKNLANFTGKHLCWNLFLIKLQASGLCKFIKKRLQHRCFAVKLAKFLRIPFLSMVAASVCKKDVLQNFAEKTLLPEFIFLIRLQDSFVKKETPIEALYYIFCEIFKNNFFTEQLQWQFLTRKSPNHFSDFKYMFKVSNKKCAS